MNYRHIFHAGNVCDVVKHAAFTLALDALRRKDTPFCVLDTHAGIGLYDLQDPSATKTAEADHGVQALVKAPPLPGLDSYYDVLRKLNPGWTPGDDAGAVRYYPGSPLLALHLFRKQDRLTACELHPEDAVALRRNLRGFSQAQIHTRDGYEALHAFLPPPEKRGLVLIDPPYEQPDELTRAGRAVADACKRWPQGQFMLWYPIKERPAVWRMHEALRDSGLPKILCAEFVYQEETRHDRLNGSGLIVVNPSWKLDEALTALFPALHAALGTEHRQSAVQWLAGEETDHA